MGLILLLGIAFLVAFLIVGIKQWAAKKNKGKFLEKQKAFWEMVQQNMAGLIPETKGFDFVLGMGSKDLSASLKGYQRLQTGYDDMPVYIVAFKGNEMYITSVRCPTMKSMTPDPDFILHATLQNIEKVERGKLGKVVLYFRDRKQFISMSVEQRAISGLLQTEECQRFHQFLDGFSQKISK